MNDNLRGANLNHKRRNKVHDKQSKYVDFNNYYIEALEQRENEKYENSSPIIY